MKEYNLIRHMAEQFPRSKYQRNALFECDAEIVRIGDEIWGMSMDEFSPEEDLFTAEDPVRLGSNLAVATLSDLFAAGVEPRFFMQSVSLPRQTTGAFARGLMEGVRKVLDASGCALCGGDTGTADPWRFSGFAMGPVREGIPLTHRLPADPQTLWVTGTLGDGNLAALQGRETPQFELRNREATLIHSCASACIDTSGGLFDAIWLLREQNPELRFEILVDEIPLAEDVSGVAGTMGFPPEAALLGGAGEYELLFATPRVLSSEAQETLVAAGATTIGSTRRDRETGLHLRRDDGDTRTMTAPPPCPRAAADIQDHIQNVMKMAVSLFGRSDGK